MRIGQVADPIEGGVRSGKGKLAMEVQMPEALVLAKALLGFGLPIAFCLHQLRSLKKLGLERKAKVEGVGPGDRSD